MPQESAAASWHRRAGCKSLSASFVHMVTTLEPSEDEMSEHHTHKSAEQEKSGCCGGKQEPKDQGAPKDEQPRAAPARRGCCG